MKTHLYFLVFITTIAFSCSRESINTQEQNDIKIVIPKEIIEEENNNPPTNVKLLSLGDSYTIGQSVCEICRFPEQLKARLKKNNPDKSIDLNVIAKTGWTTTSLINAINAEELANNFDLVTLLIGVNNQYQGQDFSIYEDEFPKLVDTAISKAKGNKKNIMVISIPDYAFTPFGKGDSNITNAINKYNLFAENYCQSNDVTYINITDITRLGLDDEELVASDGLHPSKLAYTKFVERIFPLAIEKLK